jgi:protein-L-isoaspartate(D-aspartate) O-methyltransferase
VAAGVGTVAAGRALVRQALPPVLLAALFASGAMLQTTADPSAPAERRAERLEMVERQIRGRGVDDPRVLDAMRTVPRHQFVPTAVAAYAYDDRPLSIGHGQTISQPYIVGYMSDLLEVGAHHRVLEIGTGSGYQAAVLAKLAKQVFTIEIVAALASESAATLERLGFANVRVRHGDGYAGWPDAAPFDRIIVTAAPETVPAPLVDQLAANGRMVVPVGEQRDTQWMTVLDKTAKGIVERRTIPVAFVPFTRKR